MRWPDQDDAPDRLDTGLQGQERGRCNRSGVGVAGVGRDDRLSATSEGPTAPAISPYVLAIR